MKMKMGMRVKMRMKMKMLGAGSTSLAHHTPSFYLHGYYELRITLLRTTVRSCLLISSSIPECYPILFIFIIILLSIPLVAPGGLYLVLIRIVEFILWSLFLVMRILGLFLIILLS
uniref:Uncharacterized protein n=1 Tax=Austropuccinia psidii TaxID=181123 RepID=A0A513X048_9BASI|nr:hypothetical protein [Austropuccinia psidii]QDH07301.1 hypothetical protein [Austropuccinia psidii]